jgi:hypothetical protein
MKLSSYCLAFLVVAKTALVNAQTVQTATVRVPMPPGGGGKGDPHFKTWMGDKFDYHGECDLVLVDNPSFNDGVGMRLHIRTTRVGYFSYIERAALQIGDDVLEFYNDAEDFLINGKKATEDQKTFAGFELRRFKKAIAVRLDKSSKTRIDFKVRKSGFPSILVEAGSNLDFFEGSVGLLGEYPTGRKAGRDGLTMMEGEEDDHTEYALEWQVRDTEPMLFQEARFPQYPSQCLPPAKVLGKRLGDSHMKEAAEEACAAWGDDKDECIFDVMATRDIGNAELVAETD